MTTPTLPIGHFLNKLLLYHDNNFEKDKVLMLAPIGVAAVSIESVASFSTFSIHQNDTQGKSISQLNDKKH